jgi:hypothetical protein
MCVCLKVQAIPPQGRCFGDRQVGEAVVLADHYGNAATPTHVFIVINYLNDFDRLIDIIGCAYSPTDL